MNASASQATPSDPSQSPRRIYALLIIVALSLVSGRIATVISPEGDTAFLSANDRSRWCTVAALVENGTYEIDPYLERQGLKRNRRPWSTIDLVQHRGADGRMHFYSSKPPLLPTLIAGVYWILRQVTDMTLSEFPVYLSRIVLWLVNIPMLAVFYVCSIAAMDRVTKHRWTKAFLASVICFGTLLTPFSISLNNHLAAAASTALTLWVFVRFIVPIAVDRIGAADTVHGRPSRMGFGWWVLAGLGGGWTAANELPALSMTVLWAAILLVIHRRGLLGYLLGVTLVAIAFFATNWIAHQSLRPPYAHRGNGALIAELPTENPSDELILENLTAANLITAKTQLRREPSRLENRQKIVLGDGRLFALVSKETPTDASLNEDDPTGNVDDPNGDDESVSAHSITSELRHWDDWYDYPSSYWVDGRRRGVDLGEPSRANYVTHMTIGHYGIFSLTPVWLFVPLGLVTGLFAYRNRRLSLLLASILLATAVCGVFYVMRPEIDRNYGGVSVGFRWMLWFAPLWVIAMASVVDWLARRSWGRFVSIALLAASVFTVSTSLTNPWQSPWLYQFWQFLGWIEA